MAFAKVERRYIMKTYDITLQEQHRRELLVKGLLRGLERAIKRQVVYGMYLQLASCHEAAEIIPPGVQLHTYPPDLLNKSRLKFRKEWNAEITACSRSLLGIVRRHYAYEVRKYSWVARSLEQQTVTAISHQKSCRRREAAHDVEEFINQAVSRAYNTFDNAFYDNEIPLLR